MLIKLIFLVLLSLLTAAFIMYLTEPKSEFHARVKLYMTLKIFEIQKVFYPDMKMIEYGPAP